jgi:hypothetical protein
LRFETETEQNGKIIDGKIMKGITKRLCGGGWKLRGVKTLMAAFLN